MFDLSKMSYEELQKLHTATEMVLNERKDQRYHDLVQQVCDALNALSAEFPNAELNVHYQCGECGSEEEVDILYWLCAGCKVTPSNFN